MVFWRRFFLILAVLFLSGAQMFAAGGAKEQRAYAAALNSFQDGIYPRAENEFAQFLKKFPQSTNAPQAVLLQAQAQFRQAKFTNAIALLNGRKAAAGNLAGQYDYWIGEAQFANGDFSGAAQTFAALSRNPVDSSVRLPAVVEAASAYDKLGNYPAMVALLQETNGIFRQKAQLDSDNEMVSSGRLLLARALSALNDLAGSDSILISMNSPTLKPAQNWQRAYLLCQNKIAAGNFDAALSVATNLQQIAQLAKNDNLRAESSALRAGLLEKLGQPDAAATAYQENLTNAPPERQRQAILKIAELAAAKNDRADAEGALEKFVAQFPDSSQSDLALLTLGELHLADYVAQPLLADHLPAAQKWFDQFLAAFANSPLAGKAYLDRGWCNWFAGKIPESLADFKMAAQKLPVSPEKTVAQFKIGDAQFRQKDFRGALKNYDAVLADAANDSATRGFVAPALYQMLRANLELNDLAGASNSLEQILENFPTNDLAESGALLLGEASPDPARARELFEKFERQFPGSRLRPQTGLAIARTYEQEANWLAAITNYENWLKEFPSGELQPQARYALARANFQTGNETNAFAQFAKFVAQFPTNTLAPQAQWWLADSFFRAGNFVGAETNYELIFQNTNAAWQDSPLVYPAQLMAGRAAMGRFGYSDASRYFTDLITNKDCPPELNVQACFAYGSALMLMSPPDTNTLRANFSAATNVFAQIVQAYPTNEWGALAWGEIGDCDLQLGDFDSATNAYAQTFGADSPANISARSRAQVGFGIALEKKAAQPGENDQTNLLQLALENYLDVFDGKNLRDAEQQDVFWTRKAGLQAAPLIELLNDVATERRFYTNLATRLPQLADSIAKKIAALPPEKE